MYKSVDLKCETSYCTEKGKRKPVYVAVKSLSAEYLAGEVVQDLCRGCGDKLKVAMSAPNIGASKGKKENALPGKDVRHRHVPILGAYTNSLVGEVCEIDGRLRAVMISGEGLVAAIMQAAQQNMPPEELN